MLQPKVREFEITSNEPGITSSQTLSGKRHTRRRGNVHQWIISLTTPKQNTIAAKELNAQLIKLRGTGVTQIKNPEVNLCATNAATVQADYPVGTTAINLSSLPANTVNCLIADTKMQFSSHSKVYNLDATVNSSATGTATINITPALMYPISGGDIVTINDVVFTVEKDEANESFRFSVGELHVKTMRFIEVV